MQLQRPFITPDPLERGDRIAVIAPGNGPGAVEFPELVERGEKRLRDAFDLEVERFPLVDEPMEYRTTHPEERAEEVMEAFRRSDIAGAIAVTGGSGEQIRMLEHLDPGVLRANPTRFFGFSDNTSLGMALWNAGITSSYGPMILNTLGAQPLFDHTREYVERAFFEDHLGRIEPAPEFTDETLDWADHATHGTAGEMEQNPGFDFVKGHGGTVTGRTWGGCLEVLSIQLQADRYVPAPEDLEGSVLVLETSEEVPDAYWVRWFTMALGERGLLDAVGAVLVGRPKTRHHEDPGPAARQQYREDQREAILENMDRYAPDTPVVFDLDFGHTDPITPITIGGRVEIDTAAEHIRFMG